MSLIIPATSGNANLRNNTELSDRNNLKHKTIQESPLILKKQTNQNCHLLSICIQKHNLTQCFHALLGTSNYTLLTSSKGKTTIFLNATWLRCFVTREKSVRLQLRFRDSIVQMPSLNQFQLYNNNNSIKCEMSHD